MPTDKKAFTASTKSGPGYAAVATAPTDAHGPQGVPADLADFVKSASSNSSTRLQFPQSAAFQDVWIFGTTRGNMSGLWLVGKSVATFYALDVTSPSTGYLRADPTSTFSTLSPYYIRSSRNGRFMGERVV
eukprot:tig00020952_g16481.t1